MKMEQEVGVKESMQPIEAVGEGNGSPLQCSFLENPRDGGAWRATVQGVARAGHDLATEPPQKL